MLIRSLPAYSAAKVDTHIFRAPFAAAAHAPARRGSSPMMPLVNVIDPFSLKNGMAAFAKFNWLKHLVESPVAKSSMVSSSNVLKGVPPIQDTSPSKEPTLSNTSLTLEKSKASSLRSGPERPARMTS